MVALPSSNHSLHSPGSLTSPNPIPSFDSPVPATLGRVYDSAEMGRRGKIGAHRLHSRYSSRALTVNARAAATTALDARLLREIDASGTLQPVEREKRLYHARKAHFAGLALLSHQRWTANRKNGGGDDG